MTHYQIRGGEEGRKKSSNFNNTTIIIRKSQVDSLSTLILMAQYSWNSHSVPWNTIAAFSPTSSRDHVQANQMQRLLLLPWKKKIPGKCLFTYISLFLGFSCRPMHTLPKTYPEKCVILSCLDLCQLSRADALNYLSHSSNNGAGKFRGLEHLHL